jgi:hypothetical protein
MHGSERGRGNGGNHCNGITTHALNRLNADKLVSTGFTQKHTVNNAIQEIIEAFNAGRLKNEDGCYNIKTMKQMSHLY